MKKATTLILLLVFLASCGTTPVLESQEKQKFIVETKLGSQFSGGVEIEKTGRVSSSQDILLSSNASGRIASLFVKPGDTVSAGQTLATIDDTIGSYAINLERASNGVERAQINYDSSKLQLDKQLIDAQSSLSTLTRNLETLKKNSQQNLLQAQDSLQNSQYAGLDSKSALQLEQLDNNIEKSKLDYQTKLIADEETIQGFQGNLKTNFNSMSLLLSDILDFSDKILGVTEFNRKDSLIYQNYIGAKDVSQKEQTEAQLLELISTKEGSIFKDIDARLISGNLSEQQVIESLDFITSLYEKEKTMLNNLQITLNNSIISVGQLGPTEIANFTTQINGYQTSLQANYTGFTSFSSSTISFLRTYKNTQESLAKSIELQEKDKNIQLKNFQSGELSASVGYEKTVIGIEDSISNLETQIETSKRNLQNLEDSYSITLQGLSNAIREAQISYASAAKEYGKLTITSPINGTISEKLIDKGQEVAPGVKTFNIISDNTPEVQISFSAKEKDIVQLGQKVTIESGDQKIVGKIYSISEVADTSLNYTSTIVFESGTNIIGNIVTVKVPVSTDKMLLPINIITTQGEDVGIIKTLSGSTFSDIRIRMGGVFGEYVEVLSCAQDCQSLDIIMNDISNYDANKFVIEEQKIK